MPPSATTPFLLRLILLLGLGILLFQGIGEGEPGGRPLSVEQMGPEEALRVLALDPAPTRVERSSMSPPDPEELLRLAAVAEVLPLRVVLPGTPPPLRVELPRMARAERSTALVVRGAAPSGAPLEILVQGDAGVRDSLSLTPESSGRVAGAVPFRPVRAGWHSWMISAASHRIEAGMLVQEALPLRVLVLGGPPGWESRFTIRALEESGVVLTLRQPLGGGRFVTGSPTPGLLPLPALDSVDVILLLPGGRLPGGLGGRVEAWMASGGGVVVLPGGGDTVSVPGLLEDWIVPAGQRVMAASNLIWSLPPELAPLPPLELEFPFLPLRLPGSSDWAAAASLPESNDPVLALGGVGAGRAVVVGIPATWLWRMEGGATLEHRAFWRQLVEWTAGGTGSQVVVLTPREGVATNALVHLPVEWGGGGTPPSLRLERPDGRVEALGVDLLAPGRGEASLLPGGPGLYRILDVAGEGLAGFMAVEGGGPGPGAFPRLVRLAGASGGQVVGLPGIGGSEDASTPLPDSRSWPWPLFLLVSFALLGGLEWGLRRFRGLP